MTLTSKAKSLSYSVFFPAPEEHGNPAERSPRRKQPRRAHEPPHQGARGATRRGRRGTARGSTDRAGDGARAGAGSRPRRGLAHGEAAGLQDHGLRQVQVSREEEAERGEEEAGRRPAQGSEAPSAHGGARLHDEDQEGPRVPRREQQGPYHRDVPRPRDVASRSRAEGAPAHHRGPEIGRAHV